MAKGALTITQDALDAMDEARNAATKLTARADLIPRAWSDEQRTEISIIYDMIHGTFNALNAIVNANT